MGANRRFFALASENSVFEFTIDTRNIVVGATDGSQNPLSFRIPIPSAGGNNFILRVDDGRADVLVVGITGTNSYSTITFATAGIYHITMIGTTTQFSFNQSYGYDKLKITEVTRWGSRFGYALRSFFMCSNLVIKAYNVLNLSAANNGGMFNGIKGFESPLSLLEVSKSTALDGFLRDIQTPITNGLNSFYNGLSTFNQVYYGADMSGVSEIEIISDSITVFSQVFTNTNFRGILKIKCPNLTTIFRLIYGVTNPPSLGWVDIRNCTSISDLFQYVMSKQNVDSTLIGWQNNFDWSAIPTIPNKVTIDFKNSKYSNNPSVISAKTFLESKGIVFTNLTIE